MRWISRQNRWMSNVCVHQKWDATHGYDVVDDVDNDEKYEREYKKNKIKQCKRFYHYKFVCMQAITAKYMVALNRDEAFYFVNYKIKLIITIARRTATVIQHSQVK